MTVSQIRSIPIALFIITFLCVGSISGVQKTHAQVIPTAGPANVSISIEPAHPNPYSPTTVKLESFYFRLDLANIIWTEDGIRKSGGVGVTSYSTITKGVGEKTTIEAVINIPGFDTIRKSININPSDVDMLWEAPDSYVPPFYRGKALPAREARIRVTAMPIIKNALNETIRPSNLTYRWTRNTNAVPESSGFNKNGYLFRNMLLNYDENIGVNIAAQNGYSASAEISIPLFPAKLVLYPETNTGTNYLSSIDNTTFTSGQDIGIRVSPYFFSIDPEGLLGSVSHEWKLGREIIPAIDKATSDIMRLSTNKSGTAQISITTRNDKWLFQQANLITQIRFTQ